jgi:hypothetical protein
LWPTGLWIFSSNRNFLVRIGLYFTLEKLHFPLWKYFFILNLKTLADFYENCNQTNRRPNVSAVKYSTVKLTAIFPPQAIIKINHTPKKIIILRGCFTGILRDYLSLGNTENVWKFLINFLFENSFKVWKTFDKIAK